MINPLVPLSGRVPDTTSTMGNALLTGARIAAQPHRNALLEADAQLRQAQAEAVPVNQAMQQEKMEMLRTQFEQAQKQRLNVQTLGVMKALREAPRENRAQLAETFIPELQAAGASGDSLVFEEHELDDGFLDAGITAFETQLTGSGGRPAGVREMEALTEGMSEEDNLKARRIALGLEPRAGMSAQERIAQTPGMTGAVADSQGQIAEATASGSKAGGGKETRRADRIAYGMDAARGLPTIRRALQLLERVETGGVNAVSLAVRQRLGVESADEGELNAKLGKAVLSQLRATFGAQFTEREGARLERIEAGFGKSSATNKRLLSELMQVSEKYANQAIDDAVGIEDYATAAAIKESMNFEFDEDAQFLGAAQYREGQTATGANGEKIIYRNGQWTAAE